MTCLTGVSLFAGVGGFDLAMQRNGVDVVAAVEIDANARAILSRHFPETALFNDITEVTGDDLRRAGFVPERGIITGGFPCQDLSVAGRRAGLAGARSGLFWEIVRLVDDLAPRWLVLENVPGLLSSNGGRDMGVVLGALGDLGYGWAYRVLDAQHFGVPQRRRRVFIVAGRRAGAADYAGPVQVLLEPEGVRGDFAPGVETRTRVATALTGGLGSGGPDAAHAAAGWLVPTDVEVYTSTGAGWWNEADDKVQTAIRADGNNRGPTADALVVTPTDSLSLSLSTRQQCSDAGRGEHRDDGDRAAHGPRHRVIGRDVMGTIPASIYHHGTVVNEDADAGRLVVVDESQEGRE